MSRFFERYFIRGKNSVLASRRINAAAETIGYIPGARGKGVSFKVCFIDGSDDWFMLDSELLEPGSGTAKEFASALAVNYGEPLLKISCVGSDFARLELQNGAEKTRAFINRPYAGMEYSAPDPAFWVSCCKKKWKCTTSQFEEVFSREYTFAEEGLKSLAEIINLPVSALCDEVETYYYREFWFVPKAEFEKDPFPRTLDERLSAYIDERYSERLEREGYKRFGGSPLRRHKVFGEEGRELVSSIVFVVRNGCDINLFYGCQPVCCPLMLTDKYFPMHDWPAYWIEARFEYCWQKSSDPNVVLGVYDEIGVHATETANLPLEELVLPSLERVTDIRSCREVIYGTTELKQRFELGMISGSFLYRIFVEALLSGDGAEAEKWAKKLAEDGDVKYCPASQRIMKEQQIDGLAETYLEKGAPACIEALENVRAANLKRLKKGGII